jgi:hypothetical protein
MIAIAKGNRTYAVGCFCRALGPAKTTKPIESSIQVRKSWGSNCQDLRGWLF